MDRSARAGVRSPGPARRRRWRGGKWAVRRSSPSCLSASGDTVGRCDRTGGTGSNEAGHRLGVRQTNPLNEDEGFALANRQLSEGSADGVALVRRLERIALRAPKAPLGRPHQATESAPVGVQRYSVRVPSGVRAIAKPIPPLVDAEEGLLRQVFGVVPVPGQKEQRAQHRLRTGPRRRLRRSSLADARLPDPLRSLSRPSPGKRSQPPRCNQRPGRCSAAPSRHPLAVVGPGEIPEVGQFEANGGDGHRRVSLRSRRARPRGRRRRPPSSPRGGRPLSQRKTQSWCAPSSSCYLGTPLLLPSYARRPARRSPRARSPTQDALSKPYPTMAAGLTDHVWTLQEIVGLLDSN